MMKISQENYAEAMAQEVEPFLAEHGSSGEFAARDGGKLYYERYTVENARGVLVLVHGFSETVEKYRETAYRFLKMGLQVWLFQQREHGLSVRSLQDPYKINITDYKDLIHDLHRFVHTVVMNDPSGIGLPMYLFGHSMGGGVSACYIEAYPDDFERVILSSPMLEMKSPIPVWASALFSRTMILIGKGGDGLPGAQPFDGKEDFENSASVCYPRYHYWYERQCEKKTNQMNIATLNTAWQFLQLTRMAQAQTDRVKAKVLLFQADNDTFVGSRGQDEFVRKVAGARLVHMDGTKHEIYLSTDDILEQYWKEIEGFLS